MSKKLANFIERYPNMFAEYRSFAVKTIAENREKTEALKKRKARV